MKEIIKSSDVSSFIIAIGRISDEHKIFSAYVQAKLGCFSRIIPYNQLSNDRELIYNKDKEKITISSFTGSSVKLENIKNTDKIFKLYYMDYEGHRLYDESRNIYNYDITLGYFDEKIQKFCVLLKEKPESIGLKEVYIKFGAGMDN